MITFIVAYLSASKDHSSPFLSIQKSKITPNGNKSRSATLRQENIKTGSRQEIKTGCRLKKKKEHLKTDWPQFYSKQDAH